MWDQQRMDTELRKSMWWLGFSAGYIAATVVAIVTVFVMKAFS